MKKISKYVLKVLNIIIFASFLSTSGFLIIMNQIWQGIIILYAAAFQIILIKLENIDRKLKGD